MFNFPVKIKSRAKNIDNKTIQNCKKQIYRRDVSWICSFYFFFVLRRSRTYASFQSFFSFTFHRWYSCYGFNPYKTNVIFT